MGARFATALAGGAGVVVLALVAWRLGERPEAPGIASAPAASAELAVAHGSGLDASLPGVARELPASLRGTEVDGALPLDARGALIVTPDVLDLFDYFLAASGEEPAATLRARIEREIEVRLPPAAQRTARDLLDRYLAYRAELRELSTREDLAALPLDRRIQLVRELRRVHFTPAEREALFAAEEERWRLDLERQRIAGDENLSEEDRSRQLAALDAQLPDEVREARAAATAALALRRDEATLRAAGAAESEVHALREARFGADAAERLAQLDERRSAWEGRVDAWGAERSAMLERGSAADEIDARRAELFSGPELTRALARERAEASP